MTVVSIVIDAERVAINDHEVWGPLPLESSRSKGRRLVSVELDLSSARLA